MQQRLLCSEYPGAFINQETVIDIDMEEKL